MAPQCSTNNIAPGENSSVLEFIYLIAGNENIASTSIGTSEEVNVA